MAVADAHPSIEELTAFTLGTLDEETQAPIEAHVAACTSCQERAAVAPGDNLVELVRRVRPRTGRRADTFVDTAAQVQTPVPLSAVAETDALMLAESDRPEAPDALPPELARHERYRVVRLLGVGGMGAVYEAEHLVMQRTVALKVIKRAYTANADALERFRREVRAAARLSHPNIVITYDAEDAGETHFLVMEYVEGIDLGRLVQECGPLPVDRACEYVRQAALGLQYAFEQGMVHRDLKPHNLMLTSDGRVKILDFGLARFASEAASAAGLTGTGLVLGTVDYIAPEQADNAHQADIRSDIYSLGCTLYHLLAGQPPFPTGTSLQKVMAHMEKKPQPLTELRDDLPEGLMPVLERMMAKDPKHRYQTPAEVAFALEPFTFTTAVARTPKPQPCTRETDPYLTVVLKKAPIRGRRRPRLATAVAILAFLVAGLLGVGVYRIATDKGELVIQTDNDDVEVVVSKSGKVVKIIDTKNGKHVTLNSGDYELVLKDGGEGLKLSPGKMTLKRGETVLATIERVQKREEVGEVRQFLGHTHQVRSVAFFRDGRRFVSCDHDNIIRVWDVSTAKELARIEMKAPSDWCLVLCPDQRHLLTSGRDGAIRLWDLETRKELHHKELHHFEGSCNVPGLAISPDGRWLLSGGHDNTVRLWDLKERKEVHQFKGHTAGVEEVAISSDGHRAASASWDATVRLYDLDKRSEIACLQGHKGQVRTLAFSPDGSILLTGGADDKTVRFWSVQTGKELRSAALHTGPVFSVAFSPDGRRALSASLDGTVRLLDVSTAEEVHCFTGHQGGAYCVAFSPDGRFALSGGVDRTIRLWRLPGPPPAKKKP
jgi:WD40 repeat protein/serine/threonine protein kinase